MANGNQSGFGTPGTQRTAQKNVQTGGINPNMPVGQQLAKQGASAYQRSLTTGGASPGVNLAKAAYTAPAPQLAKPSPLAGFPYKESLGMNTSLGFSNVAPAAAPGYTPPGGDLESTFMAYTAPTSNREIAAAKTSAALTGSPARTGFVQEPPVPTSSFDTQFGHNKDPATGEYSDEFLDDVSTMGFGSQALADKWGAKTEPEPEVEPGTMGEVEEEWKQTYPEDATPDEVGFGEAEKQKIYDDMQENAEFMYEKAVSNISRQYAMMGMTGSGAHISANNALAAEIANQLNNEYAELAAADLKQIEVDIQERIDNLNKKVSLGAQISLNEMQAFANFLGVADSTIIQTALSIFDEQGVTPPPGFTAMLIQGIADFANTGDQTTLNQALSVAEQSAGLVAGGDKATNDQNVLFTLYSSSGGDYTISDVKEFVAEKGFLPDWFWDKINDKAASMGLTFETATELFGEYTVWNPHKNN